MKRMGWVSLCIGLSCIVPAQGSTWVGEYLDRYFETFPTNATAAGRHDLDSQLENLGAQEREAWVRFNRDSVDRIRSLLQNPELTFEDRLDFELLLREAERQVFTFAVERAPERDPLFWTGILSNATVFLLVRDDLPVEQRLTSAAARARELPRLVGQAREALERTDPVEVAPDLCAIAERQIRSTARFYREGFPLAAGTQEDRADLRRELEESGAMAADALEQLSEYLIALREQAAGSVRLGELYARKFQLVTGLDEPVHKVLSRAQKALELKILETASFGRTVWQDIFPGREMPQDDREVIASLFLRTGEDRAETTEEFVSDYRELVDRSVEFVRAREVMTLPEPLTLRLGRSPAYFIGQSVGGVYPAGPYAPADAPTLLFLPTPAEGATADQREAFFRDFNHHFNVMITPHELIPGHYLQLKLAARHPRKVRALFGDGVYIEGWGTFAERLMLDLGWGGPLDRIAHLKKQLENIARTIVDIRVHTREWSREEVLAFVQEEALQDQQFAANMWRRAITSSPQLTYYFLGFSEVWTLFEDVRRQRGEEFDLKEFMDGMMVLGPVPVRHYRQRMLGGASPTSGDRQD